MSEATHRLYMLLFACAGNWRNCVYISVDSSGYLLTADRDGQPVVMTAEQFQQLTGERIDPAECCGQLTEAAFESLYAQYLLWHCSSAREHPLMALCKNYPGSI